MMIILIHICCSVTQSCPTFVTTLTEPHQASLSITITWSLLKLMSIESVMPSNHLILCHPLFLLPSIFPSIRSFPMSRLFTSGGQSRSFSISLSPSNEYLGLIFFRSDWFESLCRPRNSQESSPTPQFESINS